MTVINRSALVPFSAKKMFMLVDDIESYPQFLPWCKSTKVIRRSDDNSELVGSIEIAKAGVNKTFTTRNTNTENQIEMNLVDGPFKHLHGYWRFAPLDDHACKVSLDIEFSFSSKLLSMTLGPVFSQICNSLLNAYIRRANEVYKRENE